MLIRQKYAERLKVAVTGSTGFVGSHLIVELYKRGHQILALKRSTSKLIEFRSISIVKGLPDLENSIRWKDIDLNDTQGLVNVFEGFDMVFHCAGMVSYKRADRDQLRYVNGVLTQSVVNACLLAKVQKFCHLSSISVIGDHSNTGELNEESEFDHASASNYGRSKYLGEMEVHRGIQEGLQAFIVNPGIILGFGDTSKGSNTLYRNAMNNFKFYADGITGFITVEDTVGAICWLMDNADYGQRYILVSENLSFHTVHKLMADALGKERPTIKVGKRLSRLAGGIGEFFNALGFGFGITAETAKASVNTKRFSNHKIRQLGFTFTSLKDGIETHALEMKKGPYQS